MPGTVDAMLTKIREQKPQHDQPVRMVISNHDASTFINALKEHFNTNCPQCLFQFKFTTHDHRVTEEQTQQLHQLNQYVKTSYLNHLAQTQLATLKPITIVKQPKQRITVSIQVQKEFKSLTSKKHPLSPASTHSTTASDQDRESAESSLQLPAKDNSAVQNLEALTQPLLQTQLKNHKITHISSAALEFLGNHSTHFIDGLYFKSLPGGLFLHDMRGDDDDGNGLCLCIDLHASARPGEAPILTLPQPAPSTADTNFLQQSTKYLALMKKPSLNALLPHLAPWLARMHKEIGFDYVLWCLQAIEVADQKQVDLDFLKRPEVQEAWLQSPEAMFNLERLSRLGKNEIQLWNQFTIHQHQDIPLAFNALLTLYTQNFLRTCRNLGLIIPERVLLSEMGHSFIRMQRIMDIIQNSSRPQEQLIHCTELDLGPHGAHAVHQNHRFMCAQMRSKGGEEDNNQETTVFRELGQYWPAELSLYDVESLLKIIDDSSVDESERLQVKLLFAHSFKTTPSQNFEAWKQQLQTWLQVLQPLPQNNRRAMNQALFEANPQLHLDLHQLKNIAMMTRQCADQRCLNELILFTQKHGSVLLDACVQKAQKEGAAIDFKPANDLLNWISQDQDQHQNHLDSLLGLIDAEENNQIIALLVSLERPESDEDYCSALQNIVKALTHEENRPLLQLLLTIQIQQSKKLPSLRELENICLLESSQQPNTEEKFKAQEGCTECKFSAADLSKLDNMLLDGIKASIANYAFVLNQFGTLKSIIETQITNASALTPESKVSLMNLINPLVHEIDQLIKKLQEDDLNFNKLHGCLTRLETLMNDIKQKNVKIGIPCIAFEKNGAHLLKLILGGDASIADGFVDTQIIKFVYSALNQQLIDFFALKENQDKLGGLSLETAQSWVKTFSTTFSLTFFFKHELVHKKMIPAIQKKLNDLDFPKDHPLVQKMMASITTLDEQQDTSVALVHYKEKIEHVCTLLNHLLELKAQTCESPDEWMEITHHLLLCDPYLPLDSIAQFLDAAKELTKPTSLSTQRVWWNQFASNLQGYQSEKTPQALKLIHDGLMILSQLPSLDEEQKISFVSMMMHHSLRTQTSFPIQVIANIKNLTLNPIDKAALLEQIIEVLPKIKSNESIRHFLEFLEKLFSKTEGTTLLHQAAQAIAQKYEVKSQIVSLALRHAFPKYAKKGQSDQSMIDEQNASFDKLQEIIESLSKLKEPGRTAQNTILIKLLSNAQDRSLTLPRLREIAYRLNQQEDYTKQLYDKIFNQMPPYPQAAYLEELLVSTNDAERERAVTSFDLNPFPSAQNTQRDFKAHFNTEHIPARLAEVQNLLTESELPLNVQVQLAQQMAYLEGFGHYDPLCVSLPEQPTRLTQQSRLDLQKNAVSLLNKAREGKLGTTERLELLAYLREIYFRTVGKFPNATQMLTLLLSEYDSVESQNLLMQIRTGEGKSLLTPLLALLQWTRGGTVDVATSNSDLLMRDYQESCQPFFEFFKDQQGQCILPTAVIVAHTPPETYQKNGINFSTLEDLALFRLNIHENKLDAQITDPSSQGKTHLVLDECDDALLDQNTVYQLTKPASIEPSDDWAWLFRLTREFVLSRDFQESHASMEDDVFNFKGFLKTKTQDQIERYQWIDECSNAQLLEWLQATITAESYHEKKDYLVEKVEHEGRIEYICTPLVHSMPQKGCYTQSVQQALLAKIESTNPTKYENRCKIRKPSQVIAAQSAEQLIQSYLKKGGRLLGISGTPGDRAELEILRSRYNIDALSLPPNAGDQRLNEQPRFTFNDEERVQTIRQVIHARKKPAQDLEFKFNRREAETFTDQAKIRVQEQLQANSQKQTQPILIIVEDYLEAEKLGRALSAYREKDDFDLQVLNEDSKATRQKFNQFIHDAGQSQTITIATAELARGVDIKPGNHPEGLCVIQTFVDSERLTAQIAGRAARNGKKGCWIPIYKLDATVGLFHSLIEMALNTPVLNSVVSWFLRVFCGQYLKSKIEIIQQKAQERNVLQRIYTQETSAQQQKLMHHLEAWERGIEECFGPSDELSEQFWKWREELQQTLSSYLVNEHHARDLDQDIERYQTKVARTWNDFKEKTLLPYIDHKLTSSSLPSETQEERDLILGYLKHRDFEQELQENFDHGQLLQTFKTGSDRLSRHHVQSALEGRASAELRFTQLSQERQSQLKAIASQQDIMQLLINLASLDLDTAMNVKKIIDDLTKTSNSSLEAFLTELKTKAVRFKQDAVIQKEIVDSIEKQASQALQKQKIRPNELFSQLKNLILDLEADKNLSLLNRFSLQSLVILCEKIDSQTNPNDATSADSVGRKRNQIKRECIQYIRTSFSWAVRPSGFSGIFTWFHQWLNRDEITQLTSIFEATNNRNLNLALLIQELKNYQLRFKNKKFYSILHTNPSEVIDTMLQALEVVEYLPENVNLNEINQKAVGAYWLDKLKTLNTERLKIDTMTRAFEAFETRNNLSKEAYLQLFCHLHKCLYQHPSNQVSSYPYSAMFKEAIEHMARTFDHLAIHPHQPSFIQLQSQLFEQNICKPIRQLDDGLHRTLSVQLNRDEAQKFKEAGITCRGYQRPERLSHFFAEQQRKLGSVESIEIPEPNLEPSIDELCEALKKYQPDASLRVEQQRKLFTELGQILNSTDPNDIRDQWQSLSTHHPEFIQAQALPVHILTWLQSSPMPQPGLRTWIVLNVRNYFLPKTPDAEESNPQAELMQWLKQQQAQLKKQLLDEMNQQHTQAHQSKQASRLKLQRRLEFYQKEQVDMEAHHQLIMSHS